MEARAAEAGLMISSVLLRCVPVAEEKSSGFHGDQKWNDTVESDRESLLVPLDALFEQTAPLCHSQMNRVADEPAVCGC